MAKLQKYLFDMDFGAPPRPLDDVYSDPLGMPDGDMDDMYQQQVEDAPPPPPPPPTFSEEDLQLARDQAYESGRLAGVQEAEMMTERMLAMAEQAMSDGLVQLRRVQAEANEQMARDAVSVSFSILKRLYPELLRHNALDEVAGLLRECLTHLDGEVKVTVRLNPDLVDKVRDRADAIVQAVAFEGKLVYAADPRVAFGDCRVEWGDGGAERDLGRTWEEIEDVLQRALSTDDNDGPAGVKPAEGI